MPLEQKKVMSRFGGAAAAARARPRSDEITGNIAADAPKVVRNCLRLIATAGLLENRAKFQARHPIRADEGHGRESSDLSQGTTGRCAS